MISAQVTQCTPSLKEAYNLCSSARNKLHQGMRRQDHDLRQVLCHSNLLQRIESVLELDEDNDTTTSWAALCPQETPAEAKSQRHVRWIDYVNCTKDDEEGSDDDDDDDDDMLDAQHVECATSNTQRESARPDSETRLSSLHTEERICFDHGDYDPFSEVGDDYDMFDFEADEDDENDIGHGLVRVISNSELHHCAEAAPAQSYEGQLYRITESMIDAETIELF